MNSYAQKGVALPQRGGAGATQGERGMPGARCTRSRACSVESTRVSHHGCTGSPGIPARNGFNGFLRTLPGDRAFLSPSLPRSSLLKNLTPASRRQDHTTSPSASAPFVKSASTSTASLPYVRDDRETPLCVGGDGVAYEVIWVRWEAIFLIFRNSCLPCFCR